MSECQGQHDFAFLRTAKWTDGSGSYNIGFFRVDTFFCRKCLKQQEVKKETYTRDTPDWFRDD